MRRWRGAVAGLWCASAGTAERSLALLAAVGCSESLRSWRTAVISTAAASGHRWVLLTNGTELALLDAARPHARKWLTFDLRGCAGDLRAVHALWWIVAASGLRPDANGRSPLEAMIARSDADLARVRGALQEGVERAAVALTDALGRGRARRADDVEDRFEQALTVVYRVLFLQFAEARGLVPVWHPTYRRGYTIESLRQMVDERCDPRGVWEALQAIARLAHRGAHAGNLTVVPFNGRLFSPAYAPAVARSSIPDESAATLISSLTSINENDGRRSRIHYTDLGVEQLGSIYERVLDFTPVRGASATELRRGVSRKNTGSFYTPRALTEFIVHRTLDPLTREATPERILRLRLLDPAMGSGAFLVAACRELARAYERALMRAGVAGAGDFSPADRAGFRRLVAQHCLYGVDLNPMAVQLGRLSLWLCSLAADRPLTFLDHRLRVGNSILGTSLEHVCSRAPGGRLIAEPTLFGTEHLEAVGRAADARRAIEAIADESIDQVRQKEAMLAAIDSHSGPVSSWRRICDLWCAYWFWPDAQTAPGTKEFGALCDALRGDRSVSSPALSERLDAAARVARDRRFFHWSLEFPEALAEGGFDAVVGNPPWDMVRGEEGARHTLRFTREAGTFRFQSSGHGNLYQLFLERILQLARPAARIGVVLPWGIAVDDGSAALRRRILDACSVDDLVILDNHAGIFPIHRGLKFCAMLLTNGGRSDAVRYRPACRDLSELEAPLPSATVTATERIELPRTLLESLSGPTLAVPCLASTAEVRILERLVAAAPGAGDPRGWGLQFSRELNASDDKALFHQRPDGYPVISGRNIEPYRVDPGDNPLRISPDVARRRLGEAIDRPRLAYRDVAGAGNRVTLIAAIVPRRIVTTHTLFCLQNPLPLDAQLFLCALLNSYVANYIVRTRVGTHVTTTLVRALPLPRASRGSDVFRRIVSLARRGNSPAVQAAVASLYQLDDEMFVKILETFPLVPERERQAAASAFVAYRRV